MIAYIDMYKHRFGARADLPHFRCDRERVPHFQRLQGC